MAADDGGILLRDRISDLPDNILVSILCLLRIDEAARCSVLASRWRRLFPLTLLDFNAFIPGHRSTINAINSILAAHPTARVRSFRASCLLIGGDAESSTGGWLQDLARRGVEELSLSFGHKPQRIPASLFACASLTRLSASTCTFPDAAASPLALARLTEIDLWDVTISGESLHALLSQCTALERLRMRWTGNLGRIHVRSPNLRILTSDGHFDQLFIEDAPNLEWMLGCYMYMKGLRGGVHLKVAHAPKLEFLGYLGMGFHAIEIGETIFTEDEIYVKTLMPSLKTLAVAVSSYTSAGYISWFMQLLKLFPCLETIYIRSDTLSVVQASTPESWDVLRSIPCLDNHLEKVVFEVYRGHEWQIKMAKFLHGSSRFLKDMEFHCMDDIGKPPNEEWVRKQQERLCLDSRASRVARFLFFKGHLLSNHQEICHHEWYKRRYYDNCYKV